MTIAEPTHNTPTEEPKAHVPQPCILLLNGLPGVGKYTTAKALESKPKNSQTPYRSLDNHLLIDPVIAIEPIRNHDHYRLRKEFRQLAMKGLSRLSDENYVFIWTAALSTADFPTPYDDVEQFHEYLDFAELMGIPLAMVNISCEMVENEKRLVERKEDEGGKIKLFDVDVLRGIRRDTEIFSEEIAWEFARGKGMEADFFYFEIDTSGMSVEKGAERIWEFLCEEVQ